MIRYEGIARKLGDNINTDYIISSRRKRDTLDEKLLSRYLMEDIDPEFAERVHNGDIIVAGSNFGCGSAMEIAALVIRGAGICVVVAKSFARTFYRNAINNGILAVAIDTGGIAENDHIEVDAMPDGIAVKVNGMFRGKAPPISGAMVDILECGGIVEYIKIHGAFT